MLRPAVPDPSRPLPLHAVSATRAIEAAAAAILPPHTLMQRAGLAVARLARALAPHARTIWIACGPGNNGGDGLEAAAQLQGLGSSVVLTWLGDPDRASPDTRASLARAQAASVGFAPAPPDGLTPRDLCIDALLGIGAQRAPQDRMAEWIAAMNASAAPTLAVDVPTGLSADTGSTLISGAQSDHLAPGSSVIHAKFTLSLLTLKPGLFTALGRDAAGTVWWDDLDMPPPAESAVAELRATPPRPARPQASHKGHWGDIAVIGGEGLARRGMGMTGAAQLAATAALHAGAGRVMLCLLDEGALSALPEQPELMLRRFEAIDLQRSTVVCGCGGGEAVRAVLPEVLEHSARLVLDADALNRIAADAELRTRLQRRQQSHRATVLTPHPLEAARLLGTDAHSVQADRIAAARALVAAFGCTVILKGSGSIIAAPDRTPVINTTGNARLATGGTGDVLAGLCGARLAVVPDPFEAAVTAVQEHGAAADHFPPAQALTALRLAQALQP
ncbi:NAD(P)H-hydrate dehydratase [Tibeticola sp.]|uniref:NAD(P)H-hydrate dehydratase n=1 Tax=Tibeticola sp. TaxID=2005368 RepID=UPI00258FFC92|nr:NAD(P)H-hydrate dehydratase [Tibeticola sp.]MCI4440655.1 NAD(P)H-hydrate dehydratase [Tibeticola sp.]